MAHIQDRWFTRAGDGTRIPTARNGRGKRWLAWYEDAHRARRTKAFDRRVDAEAFLAQVRTDVLRGSYIDPDRGRRTFGSFAADWLAAQTFDPATRQQVDIRLRNHILPTWRRLELRAIRPLAIQKWLRDLQRVLAPNTVRVVYTNFSTILTAAVADELLARNPAASTSITRPAVSRRRVTPWTLEHVQAVLVAHPARYRAMVAVGAAAGLRQGELFGLAVDDVDFLHRVIHVRRQVKIVTNKLLFAPPKYRQPDEPARVVPLASSLGLLLAEHIQQFPPIRLSLPWRDPDAVESASASLLFTGRERRPLNKNYINSHIWKPAVQQAQLSTLRADANGMHALRHFCASNWLEQGVSIKAVAEYLGHRDEAFTLRTYTHLMPTADDKARTAADLLFDLAIGPSAEAGEADGASGDTSS